MEKDPLNRKKNALLVASEPVFSVKIAKSDGPQTSQTYLIFWVAGKKQQQKTYE